MLHVIPKRPIIKQQSLHHIYFI